MPGLPNSHLPTVQSRPDDMIPTVESDTPGKVNMYSLSVAGRLRGRVGEQPSERIHRRGRHHCFRGELRQ